MSTRYPGRAGAYQSSLERGMGTCVRDRTAERSRPLPPSDRAPGSVGRRGRRIVRVATRYARRLARERIAGANGADDSTDRSASDSRVVPVFKESHVCRAVGRLVDAVCRETCELVLRCGPARLLSKIGRQNEERLSAETRKSLVLTKDGSQLGELVTIGPQLTRRGTERAPRDGHPAVTN